jgi:HSP20 family protein
MKMLKKILRYLIKMSFRIINRGNEIGWLNWWTSLDQFERQPFRHMYPKLLSPYLCMTPKEDLFKITEDTNEIVYRITLPNIDKKDLLIEENDGMITVSGQYKYVKEGENYRESSSQMFSKKFMIPDNLDRQNIKARFENETLIMTVPKLNAKKTLEIRQIPVDHTIN